MKRAHPGPNPSHPVLGSWGLERESVSTRSSLQRLIQDHPSRVRGVDSPDSVRQLEKEEAGKMAGLFLFTLTDAALLRLREPMPCWLP
jgi:hypothetical protein